MIDRRKKIIKEIESIVKNHNTVKIGLFTGISGINVFLFYYNGNNERVCEMITRNYKKAIDEINRGIYIHTFCAGLAGFAWSLEFMISENIFERKDIEILEQIDEYLYHSMMADINVCNYDFLHGALGNGIYFLNHFPNNNSYKYLSELIDNLERISHREEPGIYKWESVLDMKTNMKGYNLGLSHGMASIVAFLTKAHLKGISTNKTKRMLTGAVNYILKNQLKANICTSIFPSWICEHEPSNGSRLAWCYGDLGIGMALYSAGKALNNNEWVEIAVNVLTHASKRRNLEKEHLVDAGICHGTAGIAHIFNRMYRNTGLRLFKETCDYWIGETLKMAKFNDGLAGYKTWHGEEDGGWGNEYGILEGIAGIGLVLLSVNNDIEPKWDECLMLS